jgi:protocatechuate 3,4-dioxygenase beta subunit
MNFTRRQIVVGLGAWCIPTPELTVGPFFVDAKLHRSDLTTNTKNPNVLSAVPLRLTLTVLRYGASSCGPLKGAQVDLWHTDAAGVYSDESVENTAGQTYLRGYQITDAGGTVKFKTIFPGWYAGRTVHIHLMVRVPGQDTARQFASQLFFDQSLIDRIASGVAPYKSRGKPDTSNTADGIYDRSTQLLLSGSPSTGYAGSFTLGVRLTGSS